MSVWIDRLGPECKHEVAIWNDGTIDLIHDGCGSAYVPRLSQFTQSEKLLLQYVEVLVREVVRLRPPIEGGQLLMAIAKQQKKQAKRLKA